MPRGTAGEYLVAGKLVDGGFTTALQSAIGRPVMQGTVSRAGQANVIVRPQEMRKVGLDAHVCCNCYERGRVRLPPPAGCNPTVSDDGSLLCGSDDLKVQIEFDRWQH